MGTINWHIVCRLKPINAKAIIPHEKRFRTYLRWRNVDQHTFVVLPNTVEIADNHRSRVGGAVELPKCPTKHTFTFRFSSVLCIDMAVIPNVVWVYCSEV